MKINKKNRLFFGFWRTIFSFLMGIIITIFIPISSAYAIDEVINNEGTVSIEQWRFDLAQTMIYCLTVVLVVFLFTYAWVAKNGFIKSPIDMVKWFSIFVTNETSNALQIFTVCGVLFSLIFLSLIGQLNEGGIAILSSIAGYIFGSRSTSRYNENQRATDKAKE